MPSKQTQLAHGSTLAACKAWLPAELPAESMTMSSGSSGGSSCSMTASTAAPALTTIITLRGLARLATKSAGV